MDFKKCGVSFYEFIVPGFPVNSFSQGESAGFGFLGGSALGCRNGCFRCLTVCPVQALMDSSISNTNEHVELLFLLLMTYGTRGFSDF